jgi:hypothetical protein
MSTAPLVGETATRRGSVNTADSYDNNAPLTFPDLRNDPEGFRDSCSVRCRRCCYGNSVKRTLNLDEETGRITLTTRTGRKTYEGVHDTISVGWSQHVTSVTVTTERPPGYIVCIILFLCLLVGEALSGLGVILSGLGNGLGNIQPGRVVLCASPFVLRPVTSLFPPLFRPLYLYLYLYPPLRRTFTCPSRVRAACAPCRLVPGSPADGPPLLYLHRCVDLLP